MKRFHLACLMVLAALPGLAAANDLAGLLHPGGVCPRCQRQEQIVYQDVISHRCKLVPEVKPIKKTVYEVKEVPFCLKKLPPICSLIFHRGDCCDDCCAECDCPRYKRVLVKKEITCGEICTSKCVVEEFVTRVPCRICTSGCPNCTQPVAPPLADQPQPLPPAQEDGASVRVVAP